MPKIRAKISASEAGRLRPQPIKDVEVEDLPIKNRYRPYKRAVARGFVSPSDLESGNSSTTVPVLPIVISSAFVPLLPAPKGLSDCARGGARVVSGLINVMSQHEGQWTENDLKDEYKRAYKLQQKIDAYKTLVRLDNDDQVMFPLLSARNYVQDFINEKHRRSGSLFQLRADLDPDTILTELGEELLEEIFCHTECHWRF
ncbi:hypothetical protein BGZ74_000464 [Mortierella antarctica]|nr:hypothetical protein BGZ74_000464 [Mortierella antarctica]